MRAELLQKYFTDGGAEKAMRLFFCAIGLAALTACSAEDGGEGTLTAVPAPDAVDIAVEEGGFTRASSTYVNASDFRYHSRIGVFAWYTGQEAWSAADVPNFMYDQMVERQYDATWTYSPVKYWPNNEDDKLTFFGYYPHAGEGIAIVGDDGDELPFTATLGGWYDAGRCAHDGSAPEGLAWSNTVRGGTVFTTAGAATADERVMLLIPGNLRGAGTDALLQYKYTYRGVTFDSEVIHLNAIDALTEWKPGKSYTYTYHVKHSGNDLSVAVNPWYQAGMVFSN